MRVLIAVGSKHGATTEIAETIASVLEEKGLDVSLRSSSAFTSIDGFDAFVIGSAVYGGRWRSAVKEFVERHSSGLQEHPVWLFSSGPLGDPLKPAEIPTDVAEMVAMTGARGHKVFAGKLDKGRLNIGERAVVRGVRAPYGDFRDWDEISDWASRIADALVGSGAVVASGR